MSQSAFLAILTGFVLVAAAAVWTYVWANTLYQPTIRAVISLGFSLVPWRELAADARSLALGGRHRAPWGWEPPKPAPEPFLGGLADWEFPVVLGMPLPPRPPTAQHELADLPVRVAEILAHDEDERRIMAGPARTNEGATGEWSPAAEVAAVAPHPAVIAHAEPDAEERQILAGLAALAAETRRVPDWMADWQRKVDATYQAAGLALDGHRRWRAAAIESPTGEMPRVLLEDRELVSA